jgi:hypothetical protein
MPALIIFLGTFSRPFLFSCVARETKTGILVFLGIFGTLLKTILLIDFKKGSLFVNE